MKKTLLLLLASTVLFSCGDKKKADEAATDKVKDKFSVDIEAIYEKNDSLVVFYAKNGYFLYDKPISKTVKGSPTLQKITVDIPEGETIDNLKITASNNKDQQFLTIKNISVINNGKVVVNGDNGAHAKYFAGDESFTWDAKAARFNLNHSNKYQPCLVGNDELMGMLTE